MKDLVHDNRVACSGMTLKHSRLCEVEPKIKQGLFAEARHAVMPAPGPHVLDHSVAGPRDLF